MATALVKGLATVATLGTASGVVALVYLNTGTTISNKLTDRGFTLISKDEDYKFPLFDNQNHEKLKQALNLSAIDHEQHVDKLKRWCENKLKEWASDDKDESIFKNAESWCTVPKVRTLRQKIQGDLHGENEWQGKYAGFAKPSTPKNEFLEILKADLNENNLVDSTNDGGEKLKKWCEDAMKLKVFEVTKNKSEENIKKWCIKG